MVSIWRKLQEYVGIPMTGNDLLEVKESPCMGIPMKTRQGLGMRNGFWMTHVFMSLMAIIMLFATNEC